MGRCGLLLRRSARRREKAIQGHGRKRAGRDLLPRLLRVWIGEVAISRGGLVGGRKRVCSQLESLGAGSLGGGRSDSRCLRGNLRRGLHRDRRSRSSNRLHWSRRDNAVARRRTARRHYLALHRSGSSPISQQRAVRAIVAVAIAVLILGPIVAGLTLWGMQP